MDVGQDCFGLEIVRCLVTYLTGLILSHGMWLCLVDWSKEHRPALVSDSGYILLNVLVFFARSRKMILPAIGVLGLAILVLLGLVAALVPNQRLPTRSVRHFGRSPPCPLEIVACVAKG